jgi:hypothetical protein
LCIKEYEIVPDTPFKVYFPLNQIPIGYQTMELNLYQGRLDAIQRPNPCDKTGQVHSRVVEPQKESEYTYSVSYQVPRLASNGMDYYLQLIIDNGVSCILGPWLPGNTQTSFKIKELSSPTTTTSDPATNPTATTTQPGNFNPFGSSTMMIIIFAIIFASLLVFIGIAAIIVRIRRRPKDVIHSSALNDNRQDPPMVNIATKPRRPGRNGVQILSVEDAMAISEAYRHALANPNWNIEMSASSRQTNNSDRSRETREAESLDTEKNKISASATS